MSEVNSRVVTPSGLTALVEMASAVLDCGLCPTTATSHCQAALIARANTTNYPEIHKKKRIWTSSTSSSSDLWICRALCAFRMGSSQGKFVLMWRHLVEWVWGQPTHAPELLRVQWSSQPRPLLEVIFLLVFRFAVVLKVGSSWCQRVLLLELCTLNESHFNLAK